MDLRGPLCLVALAVPACCVASDTRVRTTGGTRAAGSLGVGDRLLSLELGSGRLVERTIVQVRRATRECVSLAWRGGELRCTADHPLYDPDGGLYRPAGDWISRGARRLLTCTGETPEVVEVVAAEVFAGVHEVVDLSVDDEPHNFVAGGVVVHNKSIVPPASDGGDWLDAEASGPVLVLAAPGEARRFHLRVCLDGAEFQGGGFDLHVDTVTSAELGDQHLWLSLDVDVDDDEPTAATVPNTMFYHHDGSSGLCSAGVIVTFENLQGPPDAEITVAWEAVASTDHDRETPGESLEITIEPLDP
ncbi:MAG: hypothetical protein R3B09_29370 [Nannocystaceae bacterium]